MLHSLFLSQERRAIITQAKARVTTKMRDMLKKKTVAAYSAAVTTGKKIMQETVLEGQINTAKIYMNTIGVKLKEATIIKSKLKIFKKRMLIET